MADPLSVISGVVGILAASAQLITTLYQLASDIKDASSDANAAARELSSITIVIQGLQTYVMQRTRASPQRLQLITVEQITATLTGCIIATSDLDETLKSLHVDTRMHAWDKAKWLLKKDKIAQITLRLQSYKATFTMMLSILQTQSMSEAEQNMERLCDTVNEVLRSNQELALRLRNIEDLNRPLIGAPSTNSVHVDDNTGDDSSVKGSDDASSPADVEPSASGPARDPNDQEHVSSFEELLHRSRVYRNVSDNDSVFSLSLNAARSTLALSICSSLTLGEISNISVFALPIYASELSNAVYYTQEQKTSNSSRFGKPSLSRTSIGIGRGDLFALWKTYRQTRRSGKAAANDTPPHTIFGVPLKESIRYANVAISLSSEDGQSYVYGYVPIVIAKCGVFIKEKGLDLQNIFELSGNLQRVKELQVAFDTPEKYGKGLDWTGYSPYEAANVFLRYLIQLPEPVIPLDHYESFREPFTLAVDGTEDVVDDAEIAHRLERYHHNLNSLPPLNRQLFNYVFDLLCVLGSHEDRNNMSALKLAAIFQPALLSHPRHELNAAERDQSRRILGLLISNWQVYDIMNLVAYQNREEYAAQERETVPDLHE